MNSSAAAPKTVLLIIADISGYTRCITGNAKRGSSLLMVFIKELGQRSSETSDGGKNLSRFLIQWHLSHYETPPHGLTSGQPPEADES